MPIRVERSVVLSDIVLKEDVASAGPGILSFECSSYLVSILCGPRFVATQCRFQFKAFRTGGNDSHRLSELFRNPDVRALKVGWAGVDREHNGTRAADRGGEDFQEAWVVFGFGVSGSSDLGATGRHSL